MSSCWNLSPDDFFTGGGNIVMPGKLDIIIFGATGYMGARVVAEAMLMLEKFTWGVAGRDREKLTLLLDNLTDAFGVDVNNTPIIVADVENPRSLLKMTRRCRVLVNCCGPYGSLGQPVVDACIEAGTSYVDLNMETDFLEKMQTYFDADARECGAYIIPGCGWHSLPIDLGMAYLQKHFGGTINTVEAYLEYFMTTSRLPLSIAHQGLWAGLLLNGVSLRKVPTDNYELYQKQYPKLSPKLVFKNQPEESNVVSGVVVPFPFIDQQVMERSQYYYFFQDDKRPIQIQTFLRLPTLTVAIFFMIWCFIIGLCSHVTALRMLLIRYPRLFTFGLVSCEGPSESIACNTNIRITLQACGWRKVGRKSDSEFNNPPSKSLTVTMCAVNPLYGVTCMCLLASAITILEDTDKLPGCGGVLTPGVAFGQTRLLSYLRKHSRNTFSYDIET